MRMKVACLCAILFADMAQQVEHVLGKEYRHIKRGYAETPQNSAKTSFADMAQQVEHVLGKDEVPGSNPGISSKKSTT